MAEKLMILRHWHTARQAVSSYAVSWPQGGPCHYVLDFMPPASTRGRTEPAAGPAHSLSSHEPQAACCHYESAVGLALTLPVAAHLSKGQHAAVLDMPTI